MTSEQLLQIGPDQNLVVVHAEEHSWITLLRDGRTMSRESSGSPTAGFLVEPGDYVLQTDGRVVSVDLDHRELPAGLGVRGSAAARLRLSSNAPDTHEVDGIGEIPADGTSTATVTVEKLDGSGSRMAEADEEIFLRSTGGILFAADSDARIRSVRLDSGAATFRLQADASPKLVTVFAFSRARTSAAQLLLEFV